MILSRKTECNCMDSGQVYPDYVIGARTTDYINPTLRKRMFFKKRFTDIILPENNFVLYHKIDDLSTPVYNKIRLNNLF